MGARSLPLPVPYQCRLVRFIDIQLRRLTPIPKLPPSGRMNFGRRYGL